jgi:hypothetical protein
VIAMALFGHKHKKLGVLLACADWRLHQHKVDLNVRLCREFGLDGLDLIAVPGPDGLLLPDRQAEWAATQGQIDLLIKAHAPAALIVAGHQRCAGHPVEDGQHDTDIKETAKALKAVTGFPGPVRAVTLVYHSDAHWDVKPLAGF